MRALWTSTAALLLTGMTVRSEAFEEFAKGDATVSVQADPEPLETAALRRAAGLEAATVSSGLIGESERRSLPALEEARLEPPVTQPSVPARVTNPLMYSGVDSKIATIEYWERMAWCETHSDWRNGGDYAGGLGIYVGTWRRWGGLEFAKHPSLATKAEQIVVANRIAQQGWTRPDGSFQEPVWYRGWGALPCAGKPEEVALDDPRGYLVEHLGMPQVRQVPRVRD